MCSQCMHVLVQYLVLDLALLRSLNINHNFCRSKAFKHVNEYAHIWDELLTGTSPSGNWWTLKVASLLLEILVCLPQKT